ncbi:hypothetical protein QTI66_29285 [Variovorax sp. J22R133]|uniref:hypothetical protein n=1 Tax=Variovorax brevis TaxID=3053503 RepID=UPI0025776DED|nr:hypothetical protein [Variovorax sp. J22R133]MDM0116260.1 hypothetical protein [Variovorax sp. J22R133]
MSKDLYLALAAEQPTAVKLGGALITMPHAHEGREEPYNRWYEDDHMYSGAMVGPWVFAGRRFVRCKKLERFAAEGDKPTEMGSFVSLYWAIDGHIDEVWEWAQEALKYLTKEGRGPRDRTRVYSAMHELAFSHVFDPAPMQDIHALDYPYRGLAVELVDAPDAASREDLIKWLREEFVPSQAGPIGQCVAFLPRGLREERKEGADSKSNGAGVVALALDPNPERRVCLLWFLRDDPQEFWPGSFAQHAADIDAGGKGRLVLLAPFVPTLPGTATTLAE